MGFTASNYQITVKKLSQSGNGGFWWVEKDNNNDASKIGYQDTGSVDSTAQIFGAASFKNILAKMKVESISLKDIDNPINVDKILLENGIENQVKNLDSNDLAQIDADWNIQVLIKRWANPLLGIAFFKVGTITWAGLKNRFTDMGERRKLRRPRLVDLLAEMVSDGDITQNQSDSFLTEWDTNPNII